MGVEDIHDEFCNALVRAGAEPCEKLITDSQAVRADAVLRSEQVVIEVKSLTIDRNKIEAIRKKSGKIWAEEMKAGGPIPFGTVSLPFDQMDQRLAEKLLAHLGNRVRKDLRSANRQIKATASQLGLTNPHGLVVIAVPAHFSLHAGFIATVAGRVLRPGKYSSIDGLIICGVPIDGESPTSPLTFSYHPRSMNHSSNGLPERIANAWIEHLAEMEKIPVRSQVGSPKQFEDIFLVGDEDWPSHGREWPKQ